MRRERHFLLPKVFLFYLLSIAILTSGCIKYTYNIEIDNKDVVHITEIDSMRSSFIKKLDEERNKKIQYAIDIKKTNLTNEKYEIEDFDDGKYKGLKSVRHIKLSRFSDLYLPQGFSTPQNRPIVVSKSFYKKTYSILLNYNIKYATRNMIDNFSTFSDPEEEDEKIDSLHKRIKPVSELTIKIPAKAISHNADEVLNNNEYKWNLISNKPIDISIKYEKINWLNIFLTLLMIFTVILLITAIKNRDTK